MLRKWFVPLLVAAIAGLSYWLFSKQPVEKPLPLSRVQTAPDSFMENFSTLILDEQGQPHYELRAAHMAHYPDDDHSEFNTPHFTVHRPDGRRWEVWAEQGRAQNGAEQVLLSGEVLVQQRVDDSTRLEIRTRDLRVYPRDDYAETDEHTVIIRGEGRLQSEGLRADFRAGQLQLLSQVRGHYEPQP
jgi:lipopolysaccharide export system protein LptC